MWYRENRLNMFPSGIQSYEYNIVYHHLAISVPKRSILYFISLRHESLINLIGQVGTEGGWLQWTWKVGRGKPIIHRVSYYHMILSYTETTSTRRSGSRRAGLPVEENISLSFIKLSALKTYIIQPEVIFRNMHVYTYIQIYMYAVYICICTQIL